MSSELFRRGVVAHPLPEVDVQVINQMGPRVTALVRSRVPTAHVLEIAPGELPPEGTHAEVLYAPGRAPGRVLPQGDLDDLVAFGVRWVHLAGAGAEGIPPVTFEDGRIVTASKGGGAGPISEFVLASMLAYEKRFPLTWVTAAPTGAWTVPAQQDGTPPVSWSAPPRWGFSELGTLRGRTLALLGLGGIGQAVAAKALAFDMRVVALRRSGGPSPVDGVAVVPSLDELAAQADHLVLTAPSTPSTQGIVGRRVLDRVKPGVHLVNVSRGALIDQDALLEALDDGRVAFASLDVTTPEPLPEGHPFYAHPRVHLSPHVSWCNQWGQARIAELFVENLERYAAGEPLEGRVDPEAGY